MQGYGPVTEGGTLEISARFVARLAALMDSKESVEKFFTSHTRDELEDERYSSDDDDELDDDDDDGYWDSDELGIDPEELYDDAADDF